MRRQGEDAFDYLALGQAAPAALPPALARGDFLNAVAANAEDGGEVCLPETSGAIHHADSFHLSLGKLGEMAARATAVVIGWLPTFPDHVIDVVLGAAEKQVIRTNAPAVVTAMANHHSIGDRAIVHLPRKAVGIDIRHLGRHTESPIPLSRDGGSPEPACTSFLDLRPKAADGIRAPLLILAPSRAESSASSYFACICGEVFSAVGTVGSSHLVH